MGCYLIGHPAIKLKMKSTTLLILLCTLINNFDTSSLDKCLVIEFDENHSAQVFETSNNDKDIQFLYKIDKNPFEIIFVAKAQKN